MKKLILLLFIPFLMNAQEDKFEGQELVNDFIKAYKFGIRDHKLMLTKRNV